MDVKKIAQLANLPINPGEEALLNQQFIQTLTTIDLINELDTTGTEPTSQVTGLVNVTREDKIDKSRILPIDLALSPAKQVYHNYFVVPPVLDAE